MKKKMVLMLVGIVAAYTVACSGGEATQTGTDVSANDTAVSDANATVSGDVSDDVNVDTQDDANGDEAAVMSYDEYMAAELDTEVVVETYVQAKQSWWEDTATLYTQSEDGAYFIYNAACSEEDYEKLVPGTKIVVTGYKSEWSGEIEIIDATFEIVEGDTYVAEPTDVTDKLAEEDLIDYQNQYVSFTGMTVEAADDKGSAFLYNWDGSGTQGDDLYFNVSYGDEEYTFTVESYLCDSDSEVYKAVENLEVGDVIDMEGFLYWYEGVNPHIVAVEAE